MEAWRDYPPVELPRMLEVALAEIVEHGYDATSVRRIANRVGVTVPALYYHYANKQAMLKALIDRAMDLVLGHVHEALASVPDDVVARFSAVVESIVLYASHHRQLAFLDSERRSLSEENLVDYIARRDELERLLRAEVVRGVDEGRFATGVPQECSRAILTMCQGVAGWFRPDGELSPREVAAVYVRLALATVEARPPAR